ncbi:NADH:flavin oxidoreductase/NADH oxidase [Anaeromyxobacter paludicola]|uniref:FMN oxidoreductase n=1 Tax=Anaeromyxobacter paludicola TaxID=2918171 RepID=A0ABN6NAS0_9BACT|nr:NADH:flavin oxidoreductase/NADH oxidase [Anaeromyxobacter paludicola]BDG10347.1 FMN oxidoreductase [Anaeromyxobacter paludicola]
MNLFSPLKLRELTLRNRVGMSPMCQYSAEAGRANDWHLVHLGSRAVGGAGLVIFEATAVTPEGRISPADLGLWEDAQIEPLARIVRLVESHGAASCLQLAHAGRKASTRVPWEGEGAVPEAQGGWKVVAPSPVRFSDDYPSPAALDEAGIRRVVDAFAAAAGRARQAGFRSVEVHAAHGYLLHQFLSPLSNLRKDGYGGSFENRIRLTLEVARAVREAWPRELPVFIRISATDWAAGGWDLAQSVALAKALEGTVDLVDVSSGGLVPNAAISVGPGYQATFAEQIRREAGVATASVGMITSPAQADHIIRSGQADLVLLARELLRDPYWTLRAARELRQEGPWPKQYLRASR